MNSNYATQQQAFRRRAFTRTQQTPFILANKEYQLSNNIYARQYTTMSKTSNGSTSSVRQIKNQSKSRVRSVSSKSLFSPAKVATNRHIQYRPLEKNNKFVPLAKNELMINQDHESVEKKLKEVLNQKLNRKKLKIKQQTHHTQGVRKIVDDTLQKFNTRTNQEVSMNLKLRKQNLQHSYNAEKFNSLISRHMECEPTDYSKQQRSNKIVKVDAYTSMQKLGNDPKSQIHKKSIGIQVNLTDIQNESNKIKNYNNIPKIKEEKPYFYQKQSKESHEKEQTQKKTLHHKQKKLQRVQFDRKSDTQSQQRSLQISNNSKKQYINNQPKLQHKKQKEPIRKDEKFITSESIITPKAKKQESIKSQIKNTKVNLNEKEQFNLDQIEDITLTPQSKYNKKQKQPTISAVNKNQPKMQKKKIKQTKDSRMIKQQALQQQKPKQIDVQQSVKNAKQLTKPPILRKQETSPAIQEAKKKEDSQQKKNKLKQRIQKQLQQGNKIIDIMTPVGEVAGYCSQSLKKSKLNWFTPAILLYKQCYEKFKQYEPLYSKAAELGIIEQAENDKYIEENGTILKNLQKVIGMAKKKNKLSAEHQKLVTSPQSASLAPVIQKQVLVFAKEVSQSEQQENFGVLMCLLRMINSVKILAYLKGLKVQPIAEIQQVGQQQVPNLLRTNLESIQLKRLKL